MALATPDERDSLIDHVVKARPEAFTDSQDAASVNEAKTLCENNDIQVIELSNLLVKLILQFANLSKVEGVQGRALIKNRPQWLISRPL